jgi:hypothetical protein
VSRPALRLTQPPIQWVPGGSFSGGKAQPGRDADHSPHLEPRSKVIRSYISSPPPFGTYMAVAGQLFTEFVVYCQLLTSLDPILIHIVVTSV